MAGPGAPATPRVSRRALPATSELRNASRMLDRLPGGGVRVGGGPLDDLPQLARSADLAAAQRQRDRTDAEAARGRDPAPLARAGDLDVGLAQQPAQGHRQVLLEPAGLPVAQRVGHVQREAAPVPLHLELVPVDVVSSHDANHTRR